MKRNRFDTRIALIAGAAMAAILMAGCATTEVPPPSSDTVAGGQAAPAAQAVQPVENVDVAHERTVATSAAPAPAGGQPVVKVQWSNYVVKRRDTLRSIAASHHCSVTNLIAWNHLKRHARLKKGETLRIALSGAAALVHAERVVLAWPADGSVIESFEPGHNRGIEIAGKDGDPVRAAADGNVMYAGNGLNGYGTLIIVQHNADFLTAYSHSRKLLVKTGQAVKQGQAIAEMGDVDNSHAALMFEVRKDGKPVDPLPYLPSGHS